MTIVKKIRKNKGFVILFAVTISAILLSIALGVAGTALKEIKFGTSAKDTNDAFFAADTGIECALVNDKSSSNSFVQNGGLGTIQCLGANIALSGVSPKWNFVVNGLSGTGQSCAQVTVDKTIPTRTSIVSKGYNNGSGAVGVCTQGPNTVERQITITENTGTSQAVQNVAWTNVVGVGENLIKTAPTGWGNAGAVSVQSIPSGDGYVEFTVGENTLGHIGGLSNVVLDSNHSYIDIDFGINPNSAGTVNIYEKGNLVDSSAGTYVAGDVFRVSIESGVVKYYKMTPTPALLYTSLNSATKTYPLALAIALNDSGGTITNAKIFSGPAPFPAITSNVTWTNIAGVGVNLIKTAPDLVWGNAGATSSQSFASGDGYVEFSTNETTTYKMAGLSSVADINLPANKQSYLGIDYGLYPAINGGLYVYEKGTFIGQFGTYVAGDNFRVAVVSGVVNYYKNGSIFNTSATPPVYPLVFDAAFYNINSTITNAKISF